MRFVLGLLSLLLVPLFCGVSVAQTPIPQTSEEARLDDQACLRAGFPRGSGGYNRCRTNLAWRRDDIKRPEVVSGLCIFNGWPGTAQHQCCHSQRAGRRDVVACTEFAEEIRKQEECRRKKQEAEDMRKRGFLATDPFC